MPRRGGGGFKGGGGRKIDTERAPKGSGRKRDPIGRALTEDYDRRAQAFGADSRARRAPAAGTDSLLEGPHKTYHAGLDAIRGVHRAGRVRGGGGFGMGGMRGLMPMMMAMMMGGGGGGGSDVEIEAPDYDTDSDSSSSTGSRVGGSSRSSGGYGSTAGQLSPASQMVHQRWQAEQAQQQAAAAQKAQQMQQATAAKEQQALEEARNEAWQKYVATRNTPQEALPKGMTPEAARHEYLRTLDPETADYIRFRAYKTYKDEVDNRPAEVRSIASGIAKVEGNPDWRYATPTQIKAWTEANPDKAKQLQGSLAKAAEAAPPAESPGGFTWDRRKVEPQPVAEPGEKDFVGPVAEGKELPPAKTIDEAGHRAIARGAAEELYPGNLGMQGMVNREDRFKKDLVAPEAGAPLGSEIPPPSKNPPKSANIGERPDLQKKLGLKPLPDGSGYEDPNGTTLTAEEAQMRADEYYEKQNAKNAKEEEKK